MTAREYANEIGVEIVGKLTKKVATTEKFSFKLGEMVTEKNVYYLDEAGNEFGTDGTGNWYCITADGGVY